MEKHKSCVVTVDDETISRIVNLTAASAEATSEPQAQSARCSVADCSALRVLWWKLCDTYHCRRQLGISWRFAWQHAEAHVEQGWHLEMTPEQAAQEEAHAWAASC